MASAFYVACGSHLEKCKHGVTETAEGKYPKQLLEAKLLIILERNNLLIAYPTELMVKTTLVTEPIRGVCPNED